MASDLTPDGIRRANFRTVLRGLDAGEVQAFLDQVAARLDAIDEERRRLEARLGEQGARDLESEFEQIGREVSAVLQAAREASESMRERASLDAARWRSESMADSERVRKEARNDAEALRGDAWSTGSELLNQAVAEAARITEEAQREVLTVMGTAEREAHRLTSNARREAEDVMRAANMDAEKVTADATRRRDEMIDEAHRQSSSAEERTRALEERRAELLEELEGVRATLNRLEGTLEQRREDLNLSATDTPSVRVVPSALPPAIEDWEPGETVRIIPQGDEAEEEIAEKPELSQPSAPAVDAEKPESEEWEWTKPEPEVTPEPPTSPQPEPDIADTKVAVKETATPGTDDVSALFASLRGTEPPPSSDVEEEPAPPVAEPARAADPIADALTNMSDEFLATRDSRVLPVINRALRGVKKAVTDAQNVALDGLRTDEDWAPEPAQIAEGLKADVIGLWTESFTEGHEAALDMLGKKVKRPQTPPTDAADEFGNDLAEAVSEALIAAGDGQRERQSAASRVFRGWRTHEAERRVRELAYLGFRRGMEDTAANSS